MNALKRKCMELADALGFTVVRSTKYDQLQAVAPDIRHQYYGLLDGGGCVEFLGGWDDIEDALESWSDEYLGTHDVHEIRIINECRRVAHEEAAEVTAETALRAKNERDFRREVDNAIYYISCELNDPGSQPQVVRDVIDRVTALGKGVAS